MSLSRWAVTTAFEAPWKRLHSGSMAVNLVPRAYSLVRSLWPFMLALAFGGGAGGLNLGDLSFVFLFFGLAAWSTFIHWVTLRYRVHDGRLEIRTGLLQKQVRVVSPDRIQNVEMVRNIFHRVAGLVELRIETASGTEVEGLLSALSVEDASALIEQLGKARPTQEAEESLPVVVANGFTDLLRFGVTAGRAGAMAVMFGVGVEYLQYSDPERLASLGDVLGAVGAVALVIGAATGSWFLGISAAILRHYGFKLMKRPGALVATEGLFTTRQVELPLSKVQQVTITEPLLRRLAGFGSMHIETAAGKVEGSGVAHAEAMVPVVSRAAFASVLREALPAMDIELDQADWQLPHPKALVRSAIRVTFQGLFVGAALMGWFGISGAVGFLAIPLFLFLTWQDHRHQGWLITEHVVVTRHGWLNRVTQIMDRRKIQSLVVSQGPLLRGYGLGMVGVRAAGSMVALPIIDWDRALGVQTMLLDPVREDP